MRARVLKSFHNFHRASTLRRSLPLATSFSDVSPASSYLSYYFKDRLYIYAHLRVIGLNHEITNASVLKAIADRSFRSFDCIIAKITKKKIKTSLVRDERLKISLRTFQ